MSIIQRIKIEVEGFKFGYTFGKQLVLDNPLISQREVTIRTAVAWCDHLVKTDRSHLIKNKEVYHKMKTRLKMDDAVQRGNQYRVVFN